MMGRELPYILNLANSIMGVSLLAMPFCFMRCGILLGTVLLLISTMLTTITCGLLVKAGIMSKRRSYEFLAYDLFGASGKLAVEVGIAGVQLGICIAFHVIVGDLGPSLFSKWSGMENTATLRMTLMVVSALTVSLPLSLMRNIESITKLSVLSICFYFVVVLSIFCTSWHNLRRGRWTQEVDFWNTKNIFQCLPIFAMAFGCQTQMFILYDALPEPSQSALNYITRNGVNLCMIVYLVTGFFGYIAFYDKEIGGDILLSFPPSFGADLLKFGFVISVAFSFPLMVFPCRQSLNTLLFSTNESLQRHAGFTGQAPMSSNKFNSLTALIILGTLCIGINFPNVEFVIGLNGSTVGCLISFIFPAVMFLKIVDFKGEGAFKAKVVLLVGILTLCLSTYSTIQNAERATEFHPAQPDHTVGLATLIPIRELEVEPKKPEEKHLANDLQPEQQEAPEEAAEAKEAAKEAAKEEGMTRKEPPNPQPPNSDDDEQEEESKKEPPNRDDKNDSAEKMVVEKSKHSKKGEGHHKKTHKGDVDHTAQPKDGVVKIEDEPLNNADNKTDEKSKRDADNEETNKSIKKLIKRLDTQAEMNKDLLQQNQALLEGFKEIKKEKESLEGEVGINKVQIPVLPGGQAPLVAQQGQQPAQAPVHLPVQQQTQLPVQQQAQLPAQQQAQLPVQQQGQLPAQQQAQLPAQQQVQLPAQQQVQLPAQQQAQLPIQQQAQLPVQQQGQLPAQQQAQLPAQQQAQLPAQQQVQLPAQQQAQLPAQQQAQLPVQQQAQLPVQQQAQLPVQQQGQLPVQQQAQLPVQQQAQLPVQQQGQLPAQQQAQLPAQQQAQLPAQQQGQLPAQQQAQLLAQQQAQLPVQQQAQLPVQQQAQLPVQQQGQLPVQQKAQLPVQQQAQLPVQQQAQLPVQQQGQLPVQQQAQLPAQQQAQLPVQQQGQLPVQQQAQLPAQQQAQLPVQQVQLPVQQQAQLAVQQQAQQPVQTQHKHQTLPEPHDKRKQKMEEKVVNYDQFIENYEVKLAETEDKQREVVEGNQEIKKSLKEIIEKGESENNKKKRDIPDDIANADNADKVDGHVIESDTPKKSDEKTLVEKNNIAQHQKDSILDKDLPQTTKKTVSGNAKEEV
ncbi:putative sodium-coupled neutral amino acid transporter 10 isoform X2 [Watersipora subatra]|uniref:putative sodium-coupled neutral amino acid transporter 10 isoform X2 n=1 Tax=Watersipora subatra TaxID=2589382 RepID=UPI00355B099B